MFAAIVSSSIISVAGELGPKPGRGTRLKPGTPAVKVLEQAEEQRRQEKEWDKKFMDSMAREAWKNLLRITVQEWNAIEPRKERAGGLKYESHVAALGWSPSSKQGLTWLSHSQGSAGSLGIPADKMTEGQRIADALADLLDDPNSTDQQIRQKIDALQQVRENARKALPKAKQELAVVLTTARQEAVFLLTGLID